MNKLFLAAAVLALGVAPAAFAADIPASSAGVTAAHPGKMLVSADGARLASIASVDASGPQIILDGRVVTVPADTLKVVDGKLTTTLTKTQVIALP